jgi:hypothetical protein
MNYTIPNIFDERFVLVLRHVQDQQFNGQKVVWIGIYLIELSNTNESMSAAVMHPRTYFCNIEQPPFKQLNLLC